MMTKEEEILAKAYLSFKQSDAGQIILRDLRAKFFERTLIPNRDVTRGPIYPIDSQAILLDVGAREVIVYILGQTERLEYEKELERNGRST